MNPSQDLNTRVGQRQIRNACVGRVGNENLEPTRQDGIANNLFAATEGRLTNLPPNIVIWEARERSGVVEVSQVAASR